MSLENLRVIAFESRLATKMERLILKHGGNALVAPSLKEVLLKENQKALQFFEEIKAGRLDLIILMTGYATRNLLELWETQYDKATIVDTLNKKTKLVVRGPKPNSVCNIWGIKIHYRVPEPNTWQEILTLLKEENQLRGKNIGVIEYGTPNLALLTELKANGAKLHQIPIYKWELPDNLSPLNEAIDDIIHCNADLLLFTSAAQADHLLKVAVQRNLEGQLRKGLTRTTIISIGPVCSEKLRELQFFPDLEVSPNKMENLVEQASQACPNIVEEKVRSFEEKQIRVENSRSLPDYRDRLANSSIMCACRLEKNEQIPIWLMRQAGRYMAEYQMLRKGLSFLEFCKDSDIAAEATLSAVERLGVDAAIIFADILLIVEPMGMHLDFQEGLGPVISSPLRNLDAITQLHSVDVHSSLNFVLEAIKKVRKHMKSSIPLIGFCGAPFTIASYMIEGRGSKNYIPTKTLMHSEPVAWHSLMTKLTEALIDYLNAQVEAGCQLLQVFDSWIGTLSPEEYKKFVFPYNQQLFANTQKGIPTIHFGTGAGHLLPLMKKAGGNVIGLDWKTDIHHLPSYLEDVGIQGNLDPVLLFSKPEIFLPEVKNILDTLGRRPGFIFNLGHGILPETPVDHVIALVDYVKSWRNH